MRRQRDRQTTPAGSGAAKVSQVGVHRFTAGHSQECGAEKQKERRAVELG